MELIILFVTLGIIGLFLLREFWCWYFKINNRSKIEDEIHNRLKEQNEILLKLNNNFVKIYKSESEDKPKDKTPEILS